MGQVEVHNARLDDCSFALDIQLQNPVHSRERDDDSSFLCHGTAAEPGSGAPRDDNAVVSVSDLNYFGHLDRRPWKHDDVRCTLLYAAGLILMHSLRLTPHDSHLP